MGKPTTKRTKYVVSFTLEIEGQEPEEAVDEAITAVVDEELSAHSNGGTRCGVRFYDASLFTVRRDDE